MKLLGDALIQRVLPSLSHIIKRLPDNSTVYDLGAGRGRHTLCSLRAGHNVIAVERKADTFADLTKITQAEGTRDNLTLVIDDYLNVDPTKLGSGNLAIATGMLQHSKDREELEKRISYIKYLAGEPGASIFIEMLIDMKWDGKYPDGRISINQAEFESLFCKSNRQPLVKKNMASANPLTLAGHGVFQSIIIVLLSVTSMHSLSPRQS